MNTPCIMWAGYRQSNGTGYGERTVKQKRWLAHRYAFFSAKGEIPEGLCVCHRCNNKGCVNVEHLYLATHRQNVIDAVRDGLWVSHNALKKVCPNCGGAYRLQPDGRRRCMPCHVKSNRRLRQALRAAMAHAGEQKT